MRQTDLIKPYKKDHEVSYTSGAFATIELLQSRPELLRQVFIHSAFEEHEQLAEMCARHDIPVIRNDEAFRRIKQKENVYVAGVFEKYAQVLDASRAHAVLVNPADMGNLGTIIRTLAGLNITDLAVISTAADIFHPKTVRASMGALFRLRFEAFEDFADYMARFPGHARYPFMLDGDPLPDLIQREQNPLFALIFGNEARGLAPEYASIGQAVRIPQSPLTDSLNLSVAVGIGAYAFSSKYGLVA